MNTDNMINHGTVENYKTLETKDKTINLNTFNNFDTVKNTGNFTNVGAVQNSNSAKTAIFKNLDLFSNLGRYTNDDGAGWGTFQNGDPDDLTLKATTLPLYPSNQPPPSPPANAPRNWNVVYKPIFRPRPVVPLNWLTTDGIAASNRLNARKKAMANNIIASTDWPRDIKPRAPPSTRKASGIARFS